MTIKEARVKAKLTQVKAAEITGIPLRTYTRYETNAEGCSSIKKEYILQKLSDLSVVTEDKGILSIEDICKTVSDICKAHNISFCYLFGSYSKNTQTEKSDLDFLVSTDITGLSFFGLVEEFRQKLKKRIDLLRVDDIIENRTLLNEILKDGIKIYG